MDCGQPMDREGRLRRLGRCAACRPNVITGDDLAYAYTAARRMALRLARRLVGRNEAEDLVQVAALALWSAVDGLRSMSPELFVHTVKLRAQHLQRRWAHDPIPMGPEQLLALEGMQEAARRGHRERNGTVRLPEPVPK